MYKGAVTAFNKVKQSNGSVQEYKLMEFSVGSIVGMDEIVEQKNHDFTFKLSSEDTFAFKIPIDLLREDKKRFIEQVYPLAKAQNDILYKIAERRRKLTKKKIKISKSVDPEDKEDEEKTQMKRLEAFVDKLKNKKKKTSNLFKGSMSVMHKSENSPMNIKIKGEIKRFTRGKARSLPSSPVRSSKKGSPRLRKKQAFYITERKIEGEKKQKTLFDNLLLENLGKTSRLRKAKMFQSGNFDLPLFSLLKGKKLKVKKII